MRELARARTARNNFDVGHRPAGNNEPATPLGAASPSSISHIRRDAVWRGDALLVGRRKVVELVPDSVWHGMWRVKVGDHITDMVNRTRAKDAGRTLAGAVAGLPQ
jgi:hypothetical protein